jgi:hypothetical protein
MFKSEQIIDRQDDIQKLLQCLQLLNIPCQAQQAYRCLWKAIHHHLLNHVLGGLTPYVSLLIHVGKLLSIDKRKEVTPHQSLLGYTLHTLLRRDPWRGKDARNRQDIRLDRWGWMLEQPFICTAACSGMCERCSLISHTNGRGQPQILDNAAQRWHEDIQHRHAVSNGLTLNIDGIRSNTKTQLLNHAMVYSLMAHAEILPQLVE